MPDETIGMETTIDELRAQLDAAESSNNDLRGALDTANEELRAAGERQAALEAELDAAKATATKARNAARLSAGEKPVKARKFEVDPGKQPDAAQLRALIGAGEADAHKVELVFTTLGKEVAGLVPVIVQGDAWTDSANGLMLKEAVTLHGPAQGASPFTFDGYGLLIDGKPVAHRARIGGPIHVGPGAAVKIESDVIF